MVKKQFRSFEDARKFVHKLGLKSKNEWVEFAKTDKKPEDIPSNPRQVYEYEWVRWGDWTGTGNVHSRDMKFYDFEAAREYVRSLGLKNISEWRDYCKSTKSSKEIPSNPDAVYKNQGWINYGDWLGTGWIHPRERVYWSFEKARNYVHDLELKSQYEWRKFVTAGKLHKQISRSPAKFYKNKGWVSWGDWLGSGIVANRYRNFWSFEKARNYVHDLGLKSQRGWNQFVKSRKLPKEIPINPYQVFQDKGWKNWGDWLGTGTIDPRLREYWSYEKAQEYVHKLELISSNEWKKYVKSGKLPKQIPAAPSNTYKNKEWTSWGDFLGTGIIASQIAAKNFLSFDEARTKARELGKKYNLKSRADWIQAVKDGKIPENIPKQPWQSYSKKRKRK